jgi:Tol biopolymer transport system component
MYKCILVILVLFFVLHSQVFAQKDATLLRDVASPHNERDMAISPDGSDMFYTWQGYQNTFSIILHRRKLANQKWSEPEVASFSGKYHDLEPAFSYDGKKLFFSSNRPVEGDQPKDYDIWVIERVNGSWSNPVNLGAPVNTSANEFYPSVSRSGNLYYTAEYANGIGKEDIFVSKFINGNYTPAVPLDTAVNSPTWEFNAFVSPDESFILFTSYGRKDDAGGGDLYISLKNAQGNWMPSQNLKAINSNRLDYCPFVSFDRKTLYFTSGRFDLPKSFLKTISYAELQKISTSPLNGCENIYTVDFELLLKGLSR